MVMKEQMSRRRELIITTDVTIVAVVIVINSDVVVNNRGLAQPLVVQQLQATVLRLLQTLQQQ